MSMALQWVVTFTILEVLKAHGTFFTLSERQFFLTSLAHTLSLTLNSSLFDFLEVHHLLPAPGFAAILLLEHNQKLRENSGRERKRIPECSNVKQQH
ncbi:hypothetical protein Ahy_A05g024693 isoform B [Arachis hypogaea]|uniref:Secreted protein n=1 Tax=Arachis hypogaea TaxID=3818 RepID=A0A445D6R7_ARAHY|nr:hypothetical protein Ahy_A05g024693 isoform B [Arachis hypogaea]